MQLVEDMSLEGREDEPWGTVRQRVFDNFVVWEVDLLELIECLDFID